MASLPFVYGNMIDRVCRIDHSRRTSKYSNLSAGKEKQLIREMMEFGGFTSGL